MASKVLDQISLTNKGWHNQEAKKGVSTYSIGDFSDYRALDDYVAQEIE